MKRRSFGKNAMSGMAVVGMPLGIQQSPSSAVGKMKAHLPEYISFKDRKLWLNDRPDLGVAFDPSEALFLGEFTEKVKTVHTYNRPDGSGTNW